MTSLMPDDNKKMIFAPGCALMLYKPELADKLHSILQKHFGDMDTLQTCCKHDPKLAPGTTVINVCPGCDKRYANDYENVSTISLWELLADSDFFPFPDYKGQEMTIHDACPTRENEKVQTSIRALLHKMNIIITEPKNTRNKSTCCGDSFYGLVPTDQLKGLMHKRTSEMPKENVAVYCISCIKSVYIGGKTPQYLVDLLLGDATVPKTYEPDDWHRELSEYIESH